MGQAHEPSASQPAEPLAATGCYRRRRAGGCGLRLERPGRLVDDIASHPGCWPLR